MEDGSVVSFDREDSIVITVMLIAAELVLVLQVLLGLLMLVYQLPEPTRRITDFDRVET
jgi:hypothetical protein